MFLAALDARFGIVSPREHGLDTVDAIRAMRDGHAKVFMGMGGNFASATPDTAVTEAALRSCALTVQVSTKLNRSHVVHGSTALILPSLGRTDRDVQAGAKQMVSVEDSMSMVHLSRGSLQPPSDQVRSEVAIICQLARTLLGPDHPVSWERSHDQYNTTIYGLDDRYRGVKGGRRVVFVNPADIETFGLNDGARVDLVSEFSDAEGNIQERRAKDFMVVAYSTPVGNAAAYYPETNAFVALDHVAAKSNTPVSKAIVIRLEPAWAG